MTSGRSCAWDNCRTEGVCQTKSPLRASGHHIETNSYSHALKLLPIVTSISLMKGLSRAPSSDPRFDSPEAEFVRFLQPGRGGGGYVQLSHNLLTSAVDIGLQRHHQTCFVMHQICSLGPSAGCFCRRMRNTGTQALIAQVARGQMGAPPSQTELSALPSPQHRLREPRCLSPGCEDIHLSCSPRLSEGEPGEGLLGSATGTFHPSVPSWPWPRHTGTSLLTPLMAQTILVLISRCGHPTPLSTCLRTALPSRRSFS